jgi:hypothetical protein
MGESLLVPHSTSPSRKPAPAEEQAKDLLDTITFPFSMRMASQIKMLRPSEVEELKHLIEKAKSLANAGTTEEKAVASELLASLRRNMHENSYPPFIETDAVKNGISPDAQIALAVILEKMNRLAATNLPTYNPSAAFVPPPKSMSNPKLNYEQRAHGDSATTDQGVPSPRAEVQKQSPPITTSISLPEYNSDMRADRSYDVVQKEQEMSRAQRGNFITAWQLIDSAYQTNPNADPEAVYRFAARGAQTAEVLNRLENTPDLAARLENLSEKNATKYIRAAASGSVPAIQENLIADLGGAVAEDISLKNETFVNKILGSAAELGKINASANYGALSGLGAGSQAHFYNSLETFASNPKAMAAFNNLLQQHFGKDLRFDDPHSISWNRTFAAQRHLREGTETNALLQRLSEEIKQKNVLVKKIAIAEKSKDPVAKDRAKTDLGEHLDGMMALANLAATLARGDKNAVAMARMTWAGAAFAKLLLTPPKKFSEIISSIDTILNVVMDSILGTESGETAMLKQLLEQVRELKGMVATLQASVVREVGFLHDHLTDIQVAIDSRINRLEMTLLSKLDRVESRVREADEAIAMNTTDSIVQKESARKDRREKIINNVHSEMDSARNRTMGDGQLEIREFRSSMDSILKCAKFEASEIESSGTMDGFSEQYKKRKEGEPLIDLRHQVGQSFASWVETPAKIGALQAYCTNTNNSICRTVENKPGEPSDDGTSLHRLPNYRLLVDCIDQALELGKQYPDHFKTYLTKDNSFGDALVAVRDRLVYLDNATQRLALGENGETNNKVLKSAIGDYRKSLRELVKASSESIVKAIGTGSKPVVLGSVSSRAITNEIMVNLHGADKRLEKRPILENTNLPSLDLNQETRDSLLSLIPIEFRRLQAAGMGSIELEIDPTTTGWGENGFITINDWGGTSPDAAGNKLDGRNKNYWAYPTLGVKAVFKRTGSNAADLIFKRQLFSEIRALQNREHLIALHRPNAPVPENFHFQYTYNRDGEDGNAQIGDFGHIITRLWNSGHLQAKLVQKPLAANEVSAASLHKAESEWKKHWEDVSAKVLKEAKSDLVIAKGTASSEHLRNMESHRNLIKMIFELGSESVFRRDHRLAKLISQLPGRSDFARLSDDQLLSLGDPDKAEEVIKILSAKLDRLEHLSDAGLNRLYDYGHLEDFLEKYPTDTTNERLIEEFKKLYSVSPSSNLGHINEVVSAVERIDTVLGKMSGNRPVKSGEQKQLSLILQQAAPREVISAVGATLAPCEPLSSNPTVSVTQAIKDAAERQLKDSLSRTDLLAREMGLLSEPVSACYRLRHKENVIEQFEIELSVPLPYGTQVIKFDARTSVPAKIKLLAAERFLSDANEVVALQNYWRVEQAKWDERARTVNHHLAYLKQNHPIEKAVFPAKVIEERGLSVRSNHNISEDFRSADSILNVVTRSAQIVNERKIEIDRLFSEASTTIDLDRLRNLKLKEVNEELKMFVYNTPADHQSPEVLPGDPRPQWRSPTLPLVPRTYTVANKYEDAPYDVFWQALNSYYATLDVSDYVLGQVVSTYPRQGPKYFSRYE